jgi:hypothetical protein
VAGDRRHRPASLVQATQLHELLPAQHRLGTSPPRSSGHPRPGSRKAPCRQGEEIRRQSLRKLPVNQHPARAPRSNRPGPGCPTRH